MANSPAPDKVVISLRITRTLMKRLEKVAEVRKEPPARTAIHMLDDATENVTLTKEEYEEIARETEAAALRKRRGDKPTQAKSPAGKARKAEKTGNAEENEPS